jgi:hypothetical protein
MREREYFMPSVVASSGAYDRAKGSRVRTRPLRAPTPWFFAVITGVSLAAPGCGGINVAPSNDAGGARDVSEPAPDAAPVEDASPSIDATERDVAEPDVTVASQDAAAVIDATPAVDAPPADAPHEVPPWTPQAITAKLAFWFDPTSLVPLTGQVPKWTDLSGNGNDATQTTQAWEPVYTASGIGGLPSATFAGPIVFLSIADSAGVQWGTSDFALFAVARGNANTTADDAMLYQKTGPSPFDGPALYINSNKPSTSTLAAAQVSGAIYSVSTAPPATFIDGTPHLLGIRRNGVSLEIRVDGQLSNSLVNAQVGAVDVSSIGYAGIIGQNGYGTPRAEFQQFHGDIAEMVAVRGSLTPGELANLEAYLMTRYKL